jgi:putative tricarboxylic transport membrane protein
MIEEVNETDADAEPLVSLRTMNIVVAILLLVVAAIVIMDSLRLGIGWAENEGPAAGYFPFYIGLLLGSASTVNLLRALLSERAAGARMFVSRPASTRVLAVLVPLIAYVLVLTYIGIYVASALYIGIFMWYFGKYRVARCAVVGVAIAVALFLMFEVWFLVPLPKGPIEALLGF